MRRSRRSNWRWGTARRLSRSTPTCTSGRTWSTGPVADRWRVGTTRRGGHARQEPGMTAARQLVPEGLYVVVHGELVRGRAQADRVDLVGPLVVDPRRDEVGGEHAA